MQISENGNREDYMFAILWKTWAKPFTAILALILDWTGNVQLTVSLSKHRDIQLVQDPLIFVIRLSNEFLWVLLSKAEICWKVSYVLQATDICEHIWTFLMVVKSLDFKTWCILVLISHLLLSGRELCFWRLQKQVLVNLSTV